MSQLPVTARSFRGESRSVDVDHVFKWLGRGCSLFIAEPAQWLLLTLVLVVIMWVVAFIPYLIGWFISNMLVPIFVAGMLRAGQRAADEDDPEFSDLFAGFSQKTGSLIILGVLYAVAEFLIILLVLVIAGGGLLGGILRGDMSGAALALSSLTFAGWLTPFFLLPLHMAIWFAPALVFFEDAPPLAAIKASFFACCKNIVPFLTYVVLLFLLSILAALPFMLGFLVFLPVLFGSMLASYRDVFAGE